MHPQRVERGKIENLTDLPNVGPAVAQDLNQLGFSEPEQLKRQDPIELYFRLCELTKVRQDPCVLDVFISITRFMDGDAPRVWWEYTSERKEMVKQLGIQL